MFVFLKYYKSKNNKKKQKKTRLECHLEGSQRPKAIFLSKTTQIVIFVAFIQESKKDVFLESNYSMLYFIYLRSCGIKFMKFDHIYWKILAFKVG